MTIVTDLQWNLVQILNDSLNGTFPQYPYSLFGYDVAIRHDGRFLIVGIPGKSNKNCNDYGGCEVQWAPFYGAIRIYSRPKTGLFQLMDPGDVYSTRPQVKQKLISFILTNLDQKFFFQPIETILFSLSVQMQVGTVQQEAHRNKIGSLSQVGHFYWAPPQI